jgi:signal transduction histidine kinase
MIKATMSLASGAFERPEIELRSGSGQKTLVGFTLTEYIDPIDQQKGYILSLKDITYTKELQEEMIRMDRLASLGVMASGIAHEIRNPINAIGMIAQRLNKEFTPTSNPNEYGDITRLLRNEVDRINKIITQFLNYAKPIELSLTPINVKSYFEEIFRLFESQARQKNIIFVLQGSDSSIINIDPDLIKQALMNIIQNAFDAANESGKVQLNYYKQKNSFVIEVSDNGKGIPPERQKKIFDLYFTTKKDGNGLGLSISQKIIAQHKGNISVSSEINKGTTFKIILPTL